MFPAGEKLGHLITGSIHSRNPFDLSFTELQKRKEETLEHAVQHPHVKDGKTETGKGKCSPQGRWQLVVRLEPSYLNFWWFYYAKN